MDAGGSVTKQPSHHRLVYVDGLDLGNVHLKRMAANHTGFEKHAAVRYSDFGGPPTNGSKGGELSAAVDPLVAPSLWQGAQNCIRASRAIRQAVF